MKKLGGLLIFLFLGGAVLSGEISFDKLTLSGENRLLFQARAEGRGHPDYRTLFLADLESGEKKPLTFFPEDIFFVRGTGGLQIQNRFGIFRTNRDFTHIAPLQNFPTFLDGAEVPHGKLPAVLTSPDGRFVLYIEPVSPAYGELLLYDSLFSTTHRVSSRIDISLSGPAASWSPDSLFVVYSKEEALYYLSIDHILAGKSPAENFRRIGDGKISCVQWSANNDLFLLDGSLVYRVVPTEFLTRTLYPSITRQDEIAGRIPFQFDPNFDRFWVAPDGGHIILCMGGESVFLYTLSQNDHQARESIALPHLFLPRMLRLQTLIWGRNNIVTLIMSGSEKGVYTTSVYRLNIAENRSSFERTPDTDIVAIALSPDESQAAVLRKNSIEIRSYSTWTLTRTFTVFDEPLCLVWAAGGRLIVGGSHFIRSISLSTAENNLIFLSQPEEAGFQDENVLVRTRNSVRLYNTENNAWTTVEAFAPQNPVTTTAAFRVYEEELPSGPMKNAIMVRDLASLRTFPLFSAPRRHYDSPAAQSPEKVNLANFTHGSRTSRREVSLVFNAIDSAKGLDQILRTLADYRIKATFFVNGDFIRRNPGAVREIADSGHEVGSLFFTYFNMTDTRFEVNGDFIRQGLARNEDTYFAVTGRELSLLWHAPHYFVRDDIVEAAARMNYRYIGRDVDSLDWVSRTTGGRLYRPAADLVERIIELKKPGSIISLRVGRQDGMTIGSREDYLFQKLDLIINQLLARGYDIVPISKLVDHAR